MFIDNNMMASSHDAPVIFEDPGALATSRSRAYLSQRCPSVQWTLLFFLSIIGMNQSP